MEGGGYTPGLSASLPSVPELDDVGAGARRSPATRGASPIEAPMVASARARGEAAAPPRGLPPVGPPDYFPPPPPLPPVAAGALPVEDLIEVNFQEARHFLRLVRSAGVDDGAGGWLETWR